MCVLCVSRSLMSNSLWPHWLQPAGLLCPWNSLGKKIGRAIPFSRGSSQPGIEPGSPALAVRLFIVWATRKSQEALLSNKSNPINPISNKYQSKGLIFLATEVFVVRAVLWIVGCLAGSLARSQEHSHCTLWQANVFQTFLSVPQEDKIVLS